MKILAAAETAGLNGAQKKAVDRLIEGGLADERAYAIAESLTTEVRPRLGGTEAEARARMGRAHAEGARL